MRKNSIPYFLLILFWGIYSTSAESFIESPDTQVLLLELYSTQSCSSCPPAQKWVSNLKNHPEIYKKFIPIVFHVDYWNYLGWKDPYSKAVFTSRQRQYAKIWSSKNVYTPMFVLNGKEWRSRKKNELSQSRKRVGKMKVQKLNQGLILEFHSIKDLGPSLIINQAILSNNLRTLVQAGENSGRTLEQDFIALNVFQSTILRKTRKKGQFLYKTQLKDLKPLDGSLDLKQIFWVSDPQTQESIQAVSF